MYKSMDKNYFEKTLKKETAKKSEWKEIENKMNYKSLQFLIDTATQQDEGGRERGREAKYKVPNLCFTKEPNDIIVLHPD